MSGNNVHEDKDGYRVYLVPEENINVALATEGATMVKSGMSPAALDGNFTVFDGKTGFTTQIIHDDGDTNPGIIIKLRHQYILNRLRFRLWDKDNRSYSYYVDVSVNNKDWMRICDHTKYNCCSWQYIVFPQMLIRYIRIVGTFNTRNQGFHVVFVKAYLSSNEQKVGLKWEPHIGILTPMTNVATPARGARVIEGISPEFLLNGKVTGYKGSTGYTYHTIGQGAIYVQLSQPFIISSAKLLLWDGDARKFNYVMHVSTDKCNWREVCNRINQSSWQTIDFPEPLPVVYIRIMGTHNTANNGFHCVHFECPSSEHAQGSGAL